MSDFMEMEITRKGTLVTTDCPHCLATVWTHEWASWDFNGERAAMEDGTFRCPECCRPIGEGVALHTEHNVYAGRYSAPGYLDCTDYEFDTNKRRLERTLRDLYEVDAY